MILSYCYYPYHNVVYWATGDLKVAEFFSFRNSANAAGKDSAKIFILIAAELINLAYRKN